MTRLQPAVFILLSFAMVLKAVKVELPPTCRETSCPWSTFEQETKSRNEYEAELASNTNSPLGAAWKEILNYVDNTPVEIPTKRIFVDGKLTDVSVTMNNMRLVTANGENPAYDKVLETTAFPVSASTAKGLEILGKITNTNLFVRSSVIIKYKNIYENDFKVINADVYGQTSNVLWSGTARVKVLMCRDQTKGWFNNAVKTMQGSVDYLRTVIKSSVFRENLTKRIHTLTFETLSIDRFTMDQIVRYKVITSRTDEDNAVLEELREPIKRQLFTIHEKLNDAFKNKRSILQSLNGKLGDMFQNVCGINGIPPPLPPPPGSPRTSPHH